MLKLISDVSRIDLIYHEKHLNSSTNFFKSIFFNCFVVIRFYVICFDESRFKMLCSCEIIICISIKRAVFIGQTNFSNYSQYMKQKSVSNNYLPHIFYLILSVLKYCYIATIRNEHYFENEW